MKHRNLLLTFSLLISLMAQSQKRSNTVFAIVAGENASAGWMNIQEVDLSTGQVIRNIFQNGKTDFILLDAVTKKKIAREPAAVLPGSISGQLNTDIRSVPSITLMTAQKDQTAGNTPVMTRITHRDFQKAGIYNRPFNKYELPTATMVAAAAFDGRHNKLFFTPLRFGELRWMDLYDKSSSLKVYCLTGESLLTDDNRGEGGNITRMVIAADGNGYALSNDAKNLVRFTTGKKPVITRLAAITEDAASQQESIHHTSNWGGDMIADALGNLYVVSANHAVFRISIQDLKAKYLGKIEGIPQNFTTNGAAVDKEGKLIVTSANSAQGYFTVNLESLQAEKQQSFNTLLGSSDLATATLAFDRKEMIKTLSSDQKISLSDLNKINIYPNPVTNGYFRVAFGNLVAGQYSIQLTDLSGRVVSLRKVSVSGKGQSEEVRVDPRLTTGTYFVTVNNGQKKILQTDKLLLK